MTVVDTWLADALHTLAGTNPYQHNVFRITGLPIDASPGDIRNRRKEMELAASLGAPVADGGELPLADPPDAEAIRAAFETMRDPLTRLVHELLWLWPPSSGSEGATIAAHNAAILAHCTAIESEASQPSTEDATHLDNLWSIGLTRWAAAFADEQTWLYAHHRVRELDDPRLTSGIVRRLEEKLPELIISVSLGIAAEAASAADERKANRMTMLLRSAHFDATLVLGQLNRIADSSAAEIRRARDTAGAAMSGELTGAIPAVETLLETTGPALRVIELFLGPDDPLSRATHDEVASAVNQQVVAYLNRYPEKSEPGKLLTSALELAREQVTIELIEDNITINAANRIRGRVDALLDNSRADAAGVALRIMRRHSTDPVEIEAIDKLLNDPVRMVTPINAFPVKGGCFGIGTYLYGTRWGGDPGKYVSTHYFCVLFIPLIPIHAYLLGDERSCYGQVPLSSAAVWYRRIGAVAFPTLVANVFFGVTAMLVTLLFCALCLGADLATLEFRYGSRKTGPVTTEEKQ